MNNAKTRLAELCAARKREKLDASETPVSERMSVDQLAAAWEETLQKATPTELVVKPQFTPEAVGVMLGEFTNKALLFGKSTIEYFKAAGNAYVKSVGVRKQYSPEVTELAQRMLSGESFEATLPDGLKVRVENKEVVKAWR